MLKNKVLIRTVFLILVILPTVAVAQEVPFWKWWQNPQISKEIGLSDAEKTKLDEEFLNSLRKLIDLRRDVEREQFELGDLVEREALNEASVMEQFTRLEKARTNLSTERFNFLLQVRKILGPERFQRLKMFYGKSRRHGMRLKMEVPGTERDSRRSLK